MPVLPHLLHRAASATSQDTRILDSRQLRDAADSAARSVSRAARQLLRRVPHLVPRQSDGNIVAIPTVYQGLNSGPNPGAVVGIVLGSVAGFLLLLWLFWSLSNGSGFMRSSTYQEEDVDVVRRRSRSRRSSRRTEMASRSPVRRERVIRQERIVRDVRPPREQSRIRETVIVDDMPRGERRVDGDDIVEVIEEHSSVGAGRPPGRNSKGRRSSGYRSVDASSFARGD
ncbi:hypothetical protein LTR08_000717 [Meristemomyces frigidus]|nr:hypothetical protein LTR08_000717 [Meristemomyces frigidus]